MARRSKNPTLPSTLSRSGGPRDTSVKSPTAIKEQGVSPNHPNPTGAKRRTERERNEGMVGLKNEIGVTPSTTVANLKRRKAATAARTEKKSRRSISWPRSGDGRISEVLGSRALGGLLPAD